MPHEYEPNANLKLDGNNDEIGRIFTANELSEIPHAQLVGYGYQVSQALAYHRETMLQYTEEQLVEIMREGRAVIVVNPEDHDKCWAFAQISPWTQTDNNGKIVEKAVEFRSWTSRKPNQGVRALIGAVALSAIRYPGVPLYAVVEFNNVKAQKILTEAGAQTVPMPSSMNVELKAGEKPAEVITFDLSGIKT